MISKASQKDINTIISIARKTWPVAYASILSTAQIEYMLEQFYNENILKQRIDNGNDFFIIYEDSIALGFIELEYNQNAHISKLHKIYVLPAAQGKQIGKKLLHFAISESQSNSQSGISLNVNKYNTAKSFYEKMGFVQVDEVDINIGNGYYMNDYVMQLNFK